MGITDARNARRNIANRQRRNSNKEVGTVA